MKGFEKDQMYGVAARFHTHTHTHTHTHSAGGENLMDPQVFACKIKISTLQKAPYSPFLAACHIFRLTKMNRLFKGTHFPGKTTDLCK